MDPIFVHLLLRYSIFWPFLGNFLFPLYTAVHARYIRAQSKRRQLRSQGKSWVENVCLLAQCPRCARNNTEEEGATEPEPPQPICLPCNFREAGTKYSCIFFHAAPEEKKSTYKGSSPLKERVNVASICSFKGVRIETETKPRKENVSHPQNKSKLETNS